MFIYLPAIILDFNCVYSSYDMAPSLYKSLAFSSLVRVSSFATTVAWTAGNVAWPAC